MSAAPRLKELWVVLLYRLLFLILVPAVIACCLYFLGVSKWLVILTGIASAVILFGMLVTFETSFECKYQCPTCKTALKLLVNPNDAILARGYPPTACPSCNTDIVTHCCWWCRKRFSDPSSDAILRISKVSKVSNNPKTYRTTTISHRVPRCTTCQKLCMIKKSLPWVILVAWIVASLAWADSHYPDQAAAGNDPLYLGVTITGLVLIILYLLFMYTVFDRAQWHPKAFAVDPLTAFHNSEFGVIHPTKTCVVVRNNSSKT